MDTSTFKTKALRLVNYEGCVKRLLQLYKQLIRLTLVLFGCNWRRISSFPARTTHPLLKLKHSIFLVMKYE